MYYENASVASLNATTTDEFHMPVHEQVELLTDVRDGDDEIAGEAFGVLISHYRPAMVELAIRLLDGNSSAEDIVQDVLMEIFKGRERISTEGRFWALLRTCLQRRASNERRNQAKRATVSLDDFVGFDDEGEFLTLDDAHPDAVKIEETPESLMCAEEKALRIRDCMGMLSERHQEILRLKYVEEYSDADIATVMGLSGRPRAKSLAYEARQKMKAIVIEHAPDLVEHFHV